MRKPIPLTVLLFASAMPLLAQGPLTPPGPPSPTMKTLDQVEARIPFDAARTPGDATATFRITAPGSYYLTGNMTGESGKVGIFVDANHVTIDLNGYTMTGPGSGIAIETTFPPMPRNGITVRNGSITNWGSAVFLRDNARAEQLTVMGNVSDGLRVGDSSVVIECIAANNGGRGITTGRSSVVRSSTARGNGGDGIFGGDGAVVSHCTASNNSQIGIFVLTGSTVQSCTAEANAGTGIAITDSSVVADSTAARNGDFYGITGGESSQILRCVASQNRGLAGIRVDRRSQVIDCVADDNGSDTGPAAGIEGGDRTVVKRCSATKNRFHGILVGGESIVIDNRASDNGPATGNTGAGIRTKDGAAGCRIEGNQTRDNRGHGIDAEVTDVIVRNTSGNNTLANFVPSGGTNFGALQSPATATNPFANVQF